MTQDLTIENLCGGAVQERINRALRKVSDNILDPNTEAKKKREVILKLTFNPNKDDREEVSVDATVDVKLAKEEGVQTQFFINKDLRNDTITITECVKGQIKGQLSFDDLGMTLNNAPTAEEMGCDPETGEIVEEQTSNVVDFRATQEG